MRGAVYSILSPRVRTAELSSTEEQYIEDEITGQVRALAPQTGPRLLIATLLTGTLTVALRRARVLVGT